MVKNSNSINFIEGRRRLRSLHRVANSQLEILQKR